MAAGEFDGSRASLPPFRKGTCNQLNKFHKFLSYYCTQLAMDGEDINQLLKHVIVDTMLRALVISDLS